MIGAQLTHMDGHNGLGITQQALPLQTIKLDCACFVLSTTNTPNRSKNGLHEQQQQQKFAPIVNGLSCKPKNPRDPRQERNAWEKRTILKKQTQQRMHTI